MVAILLQQCKEAEIPSFSSSINLSRHSPGSHSIGWESVKVLIELFLSWITCTWVFVVIIIIYNCHPCHVSYMHLGREGGREGGKKEKRKTEGKDLKNTPTQGNKIWPVNKQVVVFFIPVHKEKLNYSLISILRSVFQVTH